MIAKRHPNDFSDIEIEPNNEKRHANQLPLGPVRRWTPPNTYTEKNIIVQHIMEILEETSAADPEQFLLRRQKRFLRSSNFWEENCQRQTHVLQVCEVLQSSEYPRKSLRRYIIITPYFSVLWPATISNVQRS